MTTYFRDFADADGISDWTEDRYANGASWSITSGVLTGGATANVEAITWNDLDADSNRADVEVYGQFRTNSTTSSTRALCIVRGNTATGSSGSEYYQLALRNSTLRASYKLNGGSLTSITDPSHGLTLATNTWYGYRFRVITDGSTNRIYGKIWLASGGEPGSWLIDGSSVTDNSIMSAGVIGVQRTAVTNTHDWQYFGVGTNGDAAPTSGGGGDVNVNLTGIAATASTGTLGAQVSLLLNGEAGAFSAGTLTPSASLSLGGESAIFAAGAVVPSVAIAAIGLQATFSPGTLTPSSSSGDTVALTGEAAAFAQTAPSISVTIALTGITATMASGLLSASSGTATITVKAGSWLRYKKLQ